MSVFDRKYPLDPDKHVGIEIEFLSPLTREKVGSILNKSALRDCYHLHGDGSIAERKKCKNCSFENNGERDSFCNHCGHTLSKKHTFKLGHELSVLFKEKDMLFVMKELSKDLKKIKASVNPTCGLHVHLDMRTRDATRSFLALVKAQTLLFTLVKKDRRDSGYCRKTIADWESSGHYSAINGRGAFEEHKTIEIRLHHGSVKVREIYNWVKLLISIVDRKKKDNKLSIYIKNQKEKMRVA